MNLDVGVFGEKFGRESNIFDDIFRDENTAILVDFASFVDGDYNGMRV